MVEGKGQSCAVEGGGGREGGASLRRYFNLTATLTAARVLSDPQLTVGNSIVRNHADARAGGRAEREGRSLPHEPARRRPAVHMGSADNGHLLSLLGDRGKDRVRAAEDAL